MRDLRLQIKNFFFGLWAGIKQARSFKRQQIPHILDTFSKKEIYLLLAALLIFILSGGFLLTKALIHSKSGPHYGGSIVEGLVGQPQFINPVSSLTNDVDTDLARIVFAQLLKYDANQNLVPDLAEKLPDVSADQKTFTLKLKPNLKWQDNKPLTADDVVFTIQTIQNADFESPLRPNWTRVKVERVDDLTLKFTLREVSASFINNFALGVLPKHIWEGLSANNFRLTNLNLKPVGSGPFVIREIKKTSDGTVKSITLGPNNNYHDGRPFINQITFKFFDDYDQLINAYQGRDITSLGFVAFDKKAFLTPSDNYSQYRINLPQYQAVFFNLPKNPILNEKAVRQALWLATDRNSIVSDVYSGQAAPAYGPILPGSLGFNPDIEKTIHNNLDEAAGILNKAGWVLDPVTNVRVKTSAKGVKTPLEFNLAINGSLVLNVKTAQILQSQWARVGAKVNLVIVGPAELEDQYIRPRTFDALLFSENTGADPDPYPFWHSSLAHDPGLNFSGFSNTEADKLMTDARQTTDPKVRIADYMRFQQIINDQLPAIFLVRSQYVYNVPKKIQGIDATNIIQPSERFMNINHWYFGN